MSDTPHEEAHTGPIKNPKQLLLTVFFSFVVPIFAIIGLVLYVTSGTKPADGAANPERALAERIQKVGMVEVRDANRPLRPGEEVFKGQCAACHATGAAGAPKLGDAAAWGPRIKTGFEALVHSALAGKGAMAPQGGGEFNDTEIARGVAYMANAAGAKFEEPAVPAAAGASGAGAGASATAEAPAAAPAPATTAAPAAPAAPATAAAPAATPAAATTVAAGAGEALYKQACQVCHAAGVAGAPKFGDKAAWAERLKDGIDGMTRIAIAGKGAMPPRGGTQASDAEIRAAVEFMANAAK
ncbi:c-type cytochrome [Paracidovorax valerianellae]|uniref:Cytochrome c5 n=1 Tax=Paracidovorax valerianellae TaxID=187868 RepID=A0A1G7ATQ9_9BURK|nr:c-type cytochrome [Paracidovorax valerianellae]MDA8446192.1 c-type cytochrome [Paracidovorax valerianellae]SDE18102.1 Cytochrome c5 [Paracidovorax valerianellae]